MKKILHVLWSASFGGIEQLVFDLAQEQNRQQYGVAEILFCKTGGEYQHKFAAGNFKCHQIGLTKGLDLRLAPYRKARSLFDIFDIVHLHQFHPAISRLAAQSKARVVYTEHGNFGFGRAKKLSDGFNNKFKKTFLNKKVDFVSFNSAFTKSIAVDRYGLENVSNEIIYNGISRNHAVVSEVDVDTDILDKIKGKFVIGTSSRFAGFKRIDRLIEAFHQFPHKDSSVLLLVGDGLLMNDLKKQVSDLDLANKVIFSGYQSEVAAYQKLMDVCVFPSKKEPFGLVAVEAFALGKPVLIFKDGGGLVEIVEAVEPSDIIDNVASLSERMVYYHDHNTTISERSEERKERAASFDIQTMEEKFNSVYQSLS